MPDRARRHERPDAMSDAPTTIPCHLLAAPALIARVAGSMTAEGICIHPPFPLRAGVCRFCGHKLPHAYRVTACKELPSEAHPEGIWEERVYDSDPMELAKGAVSGVPLSDSIVMVYGKDDRRTNLESRATMQDLPTIVCSAVGCCDALTTDIFNAASRKCREKTAAIEKAKQTKSMAHELAQKENARKAARAMGRQFASTTGNDNEQGSF